MLDGINGPKGNNFDESFGNKGISYNTMRANRAFT